MEYTKKDLKAVAGIGFIGGVGLAVMATITAIRCFTTESYANPVTASVTSDLNMDGVADMVIEMGYGRTPLYGTNKSGSVIYVSADEMEKLHPDSIIDYETIEGRLNKQGGK